MLKIFFMHSMDESRFAKYFAQLRGKVTSKSSPWNIFQTMYTIFYWQSWNRVCLTLCQISTSYFNIILFSFQNSCTMLFIQIDNFLSCFYVYASSLES